MKKLLFLGATKKILNDEAINNVLKKSELEKIFFLVHEKNDIKFFEKYGQCFYRENVAKGEYTEDAIDMRKCIPLDDTVFAYMAPYTLEIFNQQRRFEEYHSFHISGTYEEHYTIYMHNLFFWNNFLETEKITHVFFTCLPHEGYDCIIYYLSKMKNIPVKMIYNETLPQRYYVLSDFLHPEDQLEDQYQELLGKYRDTNDIPLNVEAEKMYEKLTSLEPQKMKPWYMEGNPLKRRFGIRFGVTNIFKAWEMEIGNIYIKYNYKPCWKFVAECVREIPRFVSTGIETWKRWNYARPIWKRTLELNQFYEELAEMPVEGEKYIYFALHYQPEASSNPLGGREYADQIFAIHLLARSVLPGMKIYVKVHPEQLAPLRSKAYYQDIKRISNVRIIKLECSTYDLIQNAFAVSSLTGTVCWESQFFGIPAILFGYSHKNLAPLSYHVRTYEECKKAIGDIKEKKKQTTAKELRIFFKAMYEHSFDEKDISCLLPEILKEFLA